MTQLNKTLQEHKTPIHGLTLWDLPVHGDNRGWFKENWQRDKMRAAGLPDFGPVQQNVSFNDSVGTTRGIHAEPWDKLISVATGRVFGAWVDLRAGPNFGAVFTAEIDPSHAVFVPRGVGNGFQTLEPDTAYVYLVNDHYVPGSAYTSLNVADEMVSISWPIPLDQAQLSLKDHGAPRLVDVKPVPARKTLVLGAGGQLGRALRDVYGESHEVEFAERSDLQIDADNFENSRRWQDYGAIINAAAYTKVDSCETNQGRTTAWATNVSGVNRLARIATSHRITLVHVSSDYVFDGNQTRPYGEDDPVSPLSVYGQTKAAGDKLVSLVPLHYIMRTSWLIGDGSNFVRTMASLALKGDRPSVVYDQIGRLTFASELARSIQHLINTGAPYGTYNMTASGEVSSWANIARRVFELLGHDPKRVTNVSAAEYYASRTGPIAPRPQNSALDLTRLQSTGFDPVPMDISLAAYLEREPTRFDTPSKS